MPHPTPAAADPHHLQRFLDAQSPVYPQVHAELSAGYKRTHWMWFIFPQIHGLGSSPTAQRFAIASRAEALAYLAHSVLAPRLHECTSLTLAAPASRTAEQIFAYPDDLKFHSSLTLFHAVSPTPDSPLRRRPQPLLRRPPGPRHARPSLATPRRQLPPTLVGYKSRRSVSPAGSPGETTAALPSILRDPLRRGNTMRIPLMQETHTPMSLHDVLIDELA